MGIDNYLLALV